MWKDDFIQALSRPSLRGGALETADQIKESHFPHALYKYRAVSPCNLQAFRDNYVWLADPTTYNDPYDSLFAVDTDKLADGLVRRNFESLPLANALRAQLSADEVDQIVQVPAPFRQACEAIAGGLSLSSDATKKLLDTLEEASRRRLCAFLDQVTRCVRESLKLCCFSANVTSILLWAHYADQHRGYCIEYALGELPPSDLRRRLTMPVVYSHQLFDTTAIFEEAAKGDFNNLYAVAASLRKAPYWSYEDEWRLIVPAGILPKAGPFFVPTPSAVYLGAKMPDNDRDRVREIALAKAIPVKPMRMSRSAFELEVDPSAH